jgi:hypothetical protein
MPHIWHLATNANNNPPGFAPRFTAPGRAHYFAAAFLSLRAAPVARRLLLWPLNSQNATPHKRSSHRSGLVVIFAATLTIYRAAHYKNVTAPKTNAAPFRRSAAKTRKSARQMVIFQVRKIELNNACKTQFTHKKAWAVLPRLKNDL